MDGKRGQLARFYYYLELVGVKMPEKSPPYQPGVEWLKPYFGPESNIRDPAADFAALAQRIHNRISALSSLAGQLVRVTRAG